MSANVERHQSKHSIGGSTSREREREREMRVFFLNLLWELVYYTYFKVCVDLAKNLIVRDQFWSSILTGKDERNSVVRGE